MCYRASQNRSMHLCVHTKYTQVCFTWDPNTGIGCDGPRFLMPTIVLLAESLVFLALNIFGGYQRSLGGPGSLGSACGQPGQQGECWELPRGQSCVHLAGMRTLLPTVCVVDRERRASSSMQRLGDRS